MARMESMERVVVPLTNDALSHRAVPAGRQLAALTDAPVLLISVVADDEEARARRGQLRPLAHSLELEPGRVETRVVVAGDPVSAIADTVTERDVLVVASSATVFAGDRFVGSVAESLIRSLGGPVVVIGPECDVHHPFDISSVAVALDGTERSATAIDTATAWAHLFSVPLWLLSVVGSTDPSSGPDTEERRNRCQYLQTAAHRLRSSDLDVEWAVIDDDDRGHGLLERAGADSLIVAATAGRTGLDRIAEPSLAAELYGHSRRAAVIAHAS